jgi:hypothetical protein
MAAAHDFFSQPAGDDADDDPADDSQAHSGSPDIPKRDRSVPVMR